MTTLILTPDQQHAQDALNKFILDPVEMVFVLSGFSGTGKSSMVKSFLDQLEAFMKTARLINPSLKDYAVELTATTNKAAENFAALTKRTVKTIHSYLGLRVHTDYSTGITTLIPKSSEQKRGMLILIDEASFIDKQLLGCIFKMTKDCKVILIGDPAQLIGVKSTGAPVFDANFTGAHLSQVVRQAAGNPIVDLSTKFRNTVNTGEFFSFKPDGHHVKYLDQADFNEAIKQEFTRPDWKYSDSKILGWTNKCVIGYNHAVSNHVSGNPHFQVGDYAVCNSFVSSGKKTIKTDQLVEITKITPGTSCYGVPGSDFWVDGDLCFFMPASLEEKNARIRKAKAENDMAVVAHIETQWIDLRACFSCTINKSQGSTFDAVFIDLDDVRRSNSGEQMARMLYVAVSRARNHVYLTGDIS